MTTMKFVKSLFSYHGGYLSYHAPGTERGKFVARFKYRGARKAPFQKFLIANFTVDEYFGRLDAGETPLGILISKGFTD